MLRNIFGVHSPSDSSESEDEPSESELLQASNRQTEVFYEPQNGKSPIRLQQQPRLGIAHQLWPAASFLCDFLEENQAQYLFRHEACPEGGKKSVLELGAGVGLCGIFCASIDCPRVVITDLSEALDTIRTNAEINGLQSRCEAVELRWGDSAQTEAVISTFDATDPPLVIAADCVYWECLYAPLLNTLRQLVDFGCIVVMAHVRRWKKDGKFFHMCKKYMNVNVKLEIVDTERDESCDRTVRRIRRVYEFSKK